MATKPGKTDEFEFDFEELDTDEPEIDEVDDTPVEDRGRAPMPKDIADDFEADEFEEYSDKVKQRLKQAKKLVHDERRNRERVERENNEAVSAAQRLLEENRRLKQTLSAGEKTLITSFQQSAGADLSLAEREYRDAYEAGDTDKMVEASKKLTAATMRKQQTESFVPTVQVENEEVQPYQQPARPDAGAMAWQERNTWYGTDPEMTAAALGLHQRLINERGTAYAGTDEYWSTVDKTMRKRFPEQFSDEEDEPAPRSKPGAVVVAPASRSKAPKRITLTKTQVALARKFGLTNEEYARELVKLEKQS
jgi:hypothetical protein